MAQDEGARPAGETAGTLVDGHVHLHDIFEVGPFLRAAARNFARERGRAGGRTGPDVLLLAESHGASGFERVAAHGGGGIRVEATGEPETLSVAVDGETALYVVAGRQVVTRERLEVLALGTRAAIEDGDELVATIGRVVEAGAVAVLPWGFGKWTGERGRLVREVILDRERLPHLFVGDNGGRPSALPHPALLAEAERHGRIVIPGTDPLPLPAEAGKAGRFGFALDRAPDPERPFAALREWLAALTSSPPGYGALERLPVFLERQAELRLRKGG